MLTVQKVQFGPTNMNTSRIKWTHFVVYIGEVQLVEKNLFI